MSLRTAHARWFELLTSREELTLAVETLAHTGRVELETQSGTHNQINLQSLKDRMEEFNRLARRYSAYWPPSDVQTECLPEQPDRILETALHRIHAWERQAEPLVVRIEARSREQTDLILLAEMLAAAPETELDFDLLVAAGPVLASRLFVLPARSRIRELPASLLTIKVSTEAHIFLLAVGPATDITSYTTEMSALKGSAMQLPPWLGGDLASARHQVREHLVSTATRIEQLHQQLAALAEPTQLAEALGDIHRLDWFLTNIASVPVSENFAWVTGWTSDVDDRELSKALAQANVHSIVHFPTAPQDIRAPMVMQNPWWAQPFEVFARMLGTPGDTEADPSRLLVILVPLLFGYMFGDVGHGLVLVLAGIFLKRRWPLLRILVANGIAAMLFGLVFGSVFGQEDIIPALWLHPMEQPLPVLMVPLAGGVIILLLGLTLNAIEAYWRRELPRWLRVEAAILLLYLAVIGMFWVPQAWMVIVLALAWYFTGALLQNRQQPHTTLLVAAGVLLENIFQLIINTISFVRVGAFALAHAGLLLAFETLAEASTHIVVTALILLVGNLIVIMLEGLVVTVQTTRLILFEFFIRFLHGTGRTFRPLTAPPTTTVTGEKREH